MADRLVKSASVWLCILLLAQTLTFYVPIVSAGRSLLFIESLPSGSQTSKYPPSVRSASVSFTISDTSLGKTTMTVSTVLPRFPNLNLFPKLPTFPNLFDVSVPQPITFLQDTLRFFFPFLSWPPPASASPPSPPSFPTGKSLQDALQSFLPFLTSIPISAPTPGSATTSPLQDPLYFFFSFVPSPQTAYIIPPPPSTSSPDRLEVFFQLLPSPLKSSAPPLPPQSPPLASPPLASSPITLSPQDTFKFLPNLPSFPTTSAPPPHSPSLISVPPVMPSRGALNVAAPLTALQATTSLPLPPQSPPLASPPLASSPVTTSLQDTFTFLPNQPSTPITSAPPTQSPSVISVPPVMPSRGALNVANPFTTLRAPSPPPRPHSPPPTKLPPGLPFVASAPTTFSLLPVLSSKTRTTSSPPPAQLPIITSLQGAFKDFVPVPSSYVKTSPLAHPPSLPPSPPTSYSPLFSVPVTSRAPPRPRPLTITSLQDTFRFLFLFMPSPQTTSPLQSTFNRPNSAAFP